MALEETTYRRWQPGDGIRCTYAGRAIEGFPCGPPVMVCTGGTIDGKAPRRQRALLCANHAASRFILGGIGILHTKLIKRAQEALMAAHWEEYQAELARQRPKLIAELLGQVPDEWRDLIEAAVGATAAEERPG